MTLEEAHKWSNGRNKCKENKTRLCHFIPFYEDKKDQAEFCEHCDKKVGYRIVDGRVDNARYLIDHIRDHVQPYGRNHSLFVSIYGTPKFRHLGKKKVTVEEMREEAWDTYRTARKLNDWQLRADACRK